MIPWTELNGRPVTPGWWVLPLIAAAVILIVSDGGETEQITDGNGRTLFEWEPVSRAARLTAVHATRSINWNAGTRIPGLMEIPTFGGSTGYGAFDQAGGAADGTGPRTNEMYYFRAERPIDPPPHPFEQVDAIGSREGLKSTVPTPQQLSLARAAILHHEVRATGHGRYRWTVIAPRMSVSVVVEGERNVIDSIQLSDAGGHFQDVVLAFPHATKARTVGMALAGWPGHDRQSMRSFVVENMELTQGQAIRARVTDGGRELRLQNAGPAAVFDLKMFAGPEGRLVGQRDRLTIQAGTAVRLRPHDFSLNAPQTAPIEMAVLDRIDGRVLNVRTI